MSTYHIMCYLCQMYDIMQSFIQQNQFCMIIALVFYL